MAPRRGFRPGDLSVEEPVDGFVREAGAPGVAGEAARDLLGGPALLEAGEDRGAERSVAGQPGAAPPAGAGLLLGIAGLVALGCGSDGASSREPRLLAGDPELPRCAGASARRRVSGPSHIDLQG